MSANHEGHDVRLQERLIYIYILRCPIILLSLLLSYYPICIFIVRTFGQRLFINFLYYFSYFFFSFFMKITTLVFQTLFPCFVQLRNNVLPFFSSCRVTHGDTRIYKSTHGHVTHARAYSCAAAGFAENIRLSDVSCVHRTPESILSPTRGHIVRFIARFIFLHLSSPINLFFSFSRPAFLRYSCILYNDTNKCSEFKYSWYPLFCNFSLELYIAPLVLFAVCCKVTTV